jgi:hypothetical protein
MRLLTEFSVGVTQVIKMRTFFLHSPESEFQVKSLVVNKTDFPAGYSYKKLLSGVKVIMKSNIINPQNTWEPLMKSDRNTVWESMA